MKPGKNSILVTALPILSAFTAILPGLISKVPALVNLKIAVLTMLLSAAASFYIRMNEETVLNKRYAALMILLGYLGSIGLLLYVPHSYIFCFWMLGGLFLAMTLDSKLGLLLHFTMSFLLVVARDLQPELVIQLIIIGTLMYFLAGALKAKATVIYAIIIILSTNVTISFVINNFIFSSRNNYDYLNSLLSILVVLVLAYFLSQLYEKALPAISENAQQIAEAQYLPDAQPGVHGPHGTGIQLNTSPQLGASEKNITGTQSIIDAKIVADAQLAHVLEMAPATENHSGETSSEIFVHSTELSDKSEQNLENNETKDEIYSSKNIRQEFADLTNGILTEFADDKDDSTDGEKAKETNIQSVIGTHSSYDILCSTENELMQRLKEFSLSLHAHSLRIADLSCRAAREVGANDQLAMAGGLYHEIGKIRGKDYIEEGLLIAEEYAFPKELRAILKEHNIKYDKPSSIEAAIVMLSDNVVSTLEYIGKTEELKISSNKMIENLFQMRLEKGTFDRINLSLKEFKQLKDFFIKEFKQ